MDEVRGRFGAYRVVADPISKGGIGSIHRTDDPNYVFKRYFDPRKAPDLPHLERLIGVGQDVLVRQGRLPGDTPESSINWPIDVVETAGGGVEGVVLPLIPPALFHEHSGGVRTLDFLVMARGKPPSARGRIALLLRMSELLAYIDLRGLVHGDINGKNLAWSISPTPIMYLIDCDGMVPQAPPPQHGVGAMGWTDPRVVDRLVPAHDQFSDRYALALALYRGLLLTPGKLDRRADGTWSTPKRIPDAFPDELRTLLLRGLEPLDGADRPTAAQWVDAVKSVYLPGGAFDDRLADELDELSKPPAKAPVFTTLPPIPAPPPSPAPTPQPAPAPQSQPQPVPTPQPAPPGPLLTNGPQPGPAWQPGPSWQSAPTTMAMAGPTGLARSSIAGAPQWYVLGALASLLLPLVSAIYIAIALLQLRSVDAAYPGKERAQAWLAVFGSIDVAIALYYLIAFS